MDGNGVSVPVYGVEVVPRLTIGKYITSEDDCIIPAEFKISFDNVEKERFEGVFGKYRILYVDYDANLLSVRLSAENIFIPAAAAEIEKLIDYAHRLEEGDMEVCEPEGISPEQLISGLKRSVSFYAEAAPSFGEDSPVEIEGESFILEPSVEEIHYEGEEDSGAGEEVFFDEIPPGIIEDEPAGEIESEEFITDYSEIPGDLAGELEEEITVEDLEGPEIESGEGISFDDIEVGEAAEFEELVSPEGPEDFDVEISGETCPDTGEVPLEFDELSLGEIHDFDESGVEIEPGELEEEIHEDEFEEISADEILIPSGSETAEVLPDESFPDFESLEDELVIETDDMGVQGVQDELQDIPLDAEIGDIPIPGEPEEELPGFETPVEFEETEELPVESPVETMLGEAEKLMSESRYEDAVDILDRSVLEESGSADLWVRRAEICIMAEQFADAIESYQEALDLSPDNMNVFHPLLQLLKENEEYTRASELLDTYIKRNPEDSHLWFEKGWISEKCGDNGEALMDYDQALSLDLGCTKAIANKAILLMREKRPADALECYDLLIEVKPDNAAVHHSRGLVLKLMERYDEAIDAFEKAISLDPSDTDTLLENAILLLERERYEEALEYYNKLTESGFTGSEVFSGQGDAYKALGMTAEALAAYDSAIEEGGNILGALKGKAEILAASGKSAEAGETYLDILEIDPLDTGVLHALASLYEDAGRPEMALPVYERILSADPDDITALHGRIQNLVRLGRYSEAIPLFDTLIITNPGSSDLISGKARCLAKTGRKEEAIVLYTSALEMDSGNAGYLLELVTLLSDLGRYGESVPYYDRLIRLVPEETGFVMSRALALFTSGRYEDAVSGFEDVLNVQPNDTEALLNMGTALLRLGDRRGAMECYKRSIDIDPAFNEEWSKRGIDASSFIAWEIDRIHKVSESSLRRAPPQVRPPVRREKQATEAENRETVSVEEILLPAEEPEEAAVGETAGKKVPTMEQLEDPDYLYKKGLALARKGYFRGALQCFNRVESLTGDCCEAVFSKGIIYAKNGYYTEAIECFEKVLKMTPSHERAQKAIKMVDIRKKNS